MPGGSVNGRPFRESIDSYSRTGVPCGNPRRFQSQDVVRMEPGQRSVSRPVDGPVEEIETEGQRHLQTLLKKQLDTNLTLQDHFKQTKEFSHGNKFNSETEALAGVRALADYRQHETVEQYIDDLKGFGLTEEEILFKLQCEENETAKESSKSDGIKADSEHQRLKLAEIERKIKLKQEQISMPDTFANMKPLSRHEMELEQTLAVSSQQSQFLHKMLIKQKDTTSSRQHNNPMNQLPDILTSITRATKIGPGKRKLRIQHREEKERLKRKIEEAEQRSEFNVKVTRACWCSGASLTGVDTCSCITKETEDASLVELPELQGCHNCCRTVNTDSKSSETSCVLHASTSDLSGRSEVSSGRSEVGSGQEDVTNSKTEVTCLTNEDYMKSLNKTTNGQGLTDERSNSGTSGVDPVQKEWTESVPAEVIHKYRLSVDQIRNLPRFQNYQKGEPSNILYVKNLGSKVTEADLVSLFIRYQTDSDPIVFKLLTGKMRGQAFVTFDSKETATEALELVNGYDFKGKPVIIQYGRKQTS